MAQGGHIGNGVKVGFASASPHVWNKLEQVEDVTIPILTSDKIDNTVMGTGGFHRNMAGMSTVSDMVVKMLRDNYSATSPNQNQLFALLAAKTAVWWRVEIPADPNLATTLYEAYEFQGRVLSFEPVAPIASKQEVSAKIVFDDSSFVRYEPYASVLG